MFLKRAKYEPWIGRAVSEVNRAVRRIRRSKMNKELTHINLKDFECTRIQIRIDFMGHGPQRITQAIVCLKGLHSDASEKNMPGVMHAVRDAVRKHAPADVHIGIAREEQKEQAR